MGQQMSIVGFFRRPTERREVKEIRRCPVSETCQTQRDESVSPATQSRPKGLYQKDSEFMGLPLDVIVAIFNHVEVHDAVALSLTCKGLYQHLFADARTRFKNIGWEGQLKVQAMLEKNLPYGQIYCPFCRKFHTLDHDYRSTYCLENQEPGVSSFATQVPGILTSKLTHLDARAILNAMIFEKPASNDFIKSIKHKTSAGTNESPWAQTWEFKRFDANLLAMITSTHSHYNATRDNEKFTYSVCKHVHLHARFPKLWVNRSALSKEFICTQGDYASGTCASCHADWTLSLKWSQDKYTWTVDGWEMKISSWHHLGRLRSPRDPIWAVCAGEYRSPENRLPGMSWDMIPPEHSIQHMHWKLQLLRHCSQGDERRIGRFQRIWGIAEKDAS